MPRERHVSPEKMLQLLCNINIRSAVAVYVQIENAVRFAIAAGELTGGDQLPSVRELSERLQVNPNTIAKAYRDLEVMGILYTRRGMGVFVSPGSEVRCRKDIYRTISERLFEVVGEAKAAGLSVEQVASYVKDSYSAAQGCYTEVPKNLRAIAR